MGLVVRDTEAEGGLQPDGDGDGGLAAADRAGWLFGWFAVGGRGPVVGVAEVEGDGDLVVAATVPPGLEGAAGLVIAQQLVERGVVVDAGVEVGVGSGGALRLEFLAAEVVEVVVGQA